MFSCESSDSLEKRLDFHVNSLTSRGFTWNIVLFSLKSNEIIFMNVVCCSRDWRFKG